MDTLRRRSTTARLCRELLPTMAPNKRGLVGLLLAEVAMAAHEHEDEGNGCRRHPLLSSAKRKIVLALSPHF